MAEAKKAGLSYGQWRVRNPDTRDAYKKATGKEFISEVEKIQAYRSKICPNCNKDFCPENMNRVYCSIECKIEYNLDVERGRSREYQRQLRNKRRTERSVFLESEEI